MNGGSHDHHHSDRGLKLSLWKTEEGNENERDRYGSAKVLPFKLRLMRKMSTDQMKFGDQKQQSSPTKTENSSNNNPIRVCSDCNTTKTPLWRSGPRGPKVCTTKNTYIDMDPPHLLPDLSRKSDVKKNRN